MQAQKEGEEAAAAYEKEKRDIAAGIVPASAPKPEKKPKPKEKPAKKAESKAVLPSAEKAKPTPRKRPAKQEANSGSNKKGKSLVDRENIQPLLGKCVQKATALVPLTDYAEMTDEELAAETATRLTAARDWNYCVTEVPVPAPVNVDFRPCVAVQKSSKVNLAGGAMLVGLDPAFFGWSVDAALSKHYFRSRTERERAAIALNAEYGPTGLNLKFRTRIQGSTTIVGCASRRMLRVYSKLGMGTPTLGGSIGNIDCNIGGNSSCTESAAVISFMPQASSSSAFQVSSLSDDDGVYVNGQKVNGGDACTLMNEDICTIGARVFVFLLPVDT